MVPHPLLDPRLGAVQQGVPANNKVGQLTWAQVVVLRARGVGAHGGAGLLLPPPLRAAQPEADQGLQQADALGCCQIAVLFVLGPTCHCQPMGSWTARRCAMQVGGWHMHASKQACCKHFNLQRLDGSLGIGAERPAATQPLPDLLRPGDSCKTPAGGRAG